MNGKMKKSIDFSGVTQCVVLVEDPDESERVQKALFSLGFRWFSGDRRAKATDIRCLFFDKDITHTSKLEYGVNKILNGKAYPIKASQILKSPESVPWGKPEETITIDGKEFSVSTVKRALREYIGD